MAVSFDALKNELEVLLISDPTVLQALPAPYLANLRTQLSLSDAAQIEYLRSLSIPKRDLFLQYIASPGNLNDWRLALQTEQERLDAAAAENKRAQEALATQNLLLQQQRMQAEAKLAADALERERAAAEAAQLKASRFNAARARTGF